jgi:hypothetical protein
MLGVICAVVAAVLFAIAWIGGANHDLLYAGLTFLALAHVLGDLPVNFGRSPRRRI